MNPAAPTREAMHGLILPPPVAFWPATPAWYVLFALIATLLAWAGWRAWRRWRVNAYRREALRDLQDAEGPAIAVILKRTALAGWPREAVASLSGQDWAVFLRRTAPRAQLDLATAQALAVLAYGPPTPDARFAAARWIRLHDVRL